MASCVAWSPSTDTETATMPASFMRRESSRDTPYPPRDHAARHASIGDGPRDGEPILAQKCLSAFDGDFVDALLRHLPHEIQGFLGAELVVTRLTRARSAMLLIREVALESQLPHRVSVPFTPLPGTHCFANPLSECDRSALHRVSGSVYTKP
jgi:hypothetical protein